VTSELEEAIFLADRLIVLTNRPTRVKKIMEIDLPRPRSYHVLASARYLALKEEALEALHEQALQGVRSRKRGRVRPGRGLSKARARRMMDAVYFTRLRLIRAGLTPSISPAIVSPCTVRRPVMLVGSRIRS